MMGYLRFFFLALTAMFFGACSADSDPVAEVPAVENGDYSAAEGNTLVVYYSYTGNCRDIVQLMLKYLYHPEATVIIFVDYSLDTC